MLYPYITKSFTTSAALNNAIMNLKITWRVSDITPGIPMALSSGDTVLYQINTTDYGVTLVFIARNPLYGWSDKLYKKAVTLDFVNGVAAFDVPDGSASIPVQTSDLKRLLVPSAGASDRQLWLLSHQDVVLILDKQRLEDLLSTFYPDVVEPYNTIFDPIPDVVHIGGGFGSVGVDKPLMLTNSPMKNGLNIVPAMNWVVRGNGIGLTLNTAHGDAVDNTAIKQINGTTAVNGNIDIKILQG